MSLDVARRITNKQNMLSQRTLTFIIVIIFLMSIGEGAVTPAIPLHGAAPVSYTHLDVYKRQVYGPAFTGDIMQLYRGKHESIRGGRGGLDC